MSGVRNVVRTPKNEAHRVMPSGGLFGFQAAVYILHLFSGSYNALV